MLSLYCKSGLYTELFCYYSPMVSDEMRLHAAVGFYMDSASLFASAHIPVYCSLLRGAIGLERIGEAREVTQRHHCHSRDSPLLSFPLTTQPRA